MGQSKTPARVTGEVSDEGQSDEEGKGKRHAVQLSLNEVSMRMVLKAHAEACQAFIKPLTFGEMMAIGACMLKDQGLNELANKFERANMKRYIGSKKLMIASEKPVMDLNGWLATELSKHLGIRVLLKEIVTLGLYEVVTARDVEIRATSACVGRLKKRGKRLTAACG